MPLDVPSDLERRLRLAAAQHYLDDFDSLEAVKLADELVVAGVDDDAILALAVLPLDRRELQTDQVSQLFRDVLKALHVIISSEAEAGWIYAAGLASGLASGTLEPDLGASRLWRLHEYIGVVPGSSPLDMLHLSESWEQATQEADRRTVEALIIESAHSVIVESERALAALALPPGYQPGRVRPEDVIPLLLAAAPSFLSTWYEIHEENVDDEYEFGRFHYLDANMFARHIIVMYEWNHQQAIQRSFDVIERMHLEGEPYVVELATIGYLEGIQTHAGHAGIDEGVFARYLGPESRRWWVGLTRFWLGKASAVLPYDDES